MSFPSPVNAAQGAARELIFWKSQLSSTDRGTVYTSQSGFLS